MNVEVGDALVGERLDRAVALVCGCSRRDAAAAVEDGRVAIDGAVVTTRSRRLAGGETIDVPALAAAPTPPIEPDPAVAFTVVHADDDVAIVDKPAGVVVHPGAGTRGSTLVHGLVARWPQISEVGDRERPGIVHRLDRGTSGLMVVALSERARTALVTALARREITRRYVGLVHGHLDAAAGMVDAPIGRGRRDRTKMTVTVDGRPARTRYEAIARWDDPVMSALRCTLETGRTHQIRVHLAAIGHAVVADPTYGRSPELGLNRPFLHAAELAFSHPVTGVEVRATSPLAADLVAALEILGPPAEGAVASPGG